VSDDIEAPEVPFREKLAALYRVAAYRPKFATGIIVLSIFAALLEGIGLSFLIPVIEIAQGNTGPDEVSGIGQVFILTFEFVGIPFILEWVIAGVALVMIARYTASFLVLWLQAALQTHYIRHLQTKGFENALNARISYYDKQGSDEILNAIVTQSEYASRTIREGVRLIEQGFLSLMYLGIALYIAPWFTILSGIVLGGILYGLRWLIESGYSVGDRVADANERIQEAVQAGTQGIREVKLFGLADELFSEFQTAVDQFAGSQIKLRRNQAILENIYQMVTAITVFVLIYVALTVASLTLATLGVFLFAMFRLAPRVSTLNNLAYKLEGDLPHMVRTQRFVSDLVAQEEVNNGEKSPPDPVDDVAFETLEFSYGTEKVLDGVSFEVDRGEFVAFVGPSGAGKSTIVSLLTRMYESDSGQILASGTPIEEFVLEEWRDRLSVVRQDPFIFNESFRYNITIGNRDASEEEILKVCEIAQVTEFLDELPKGLDTVLGDEGVRLSGGQRHRVALARALLKDADLLVLDEATSDLDSNIEKTVHRAIENMERDYAMIVIAHRLSTVVNADRIYTMEDGKIEEKGIHEELIDRDGTYADLYATQTQSR
jgi:subfamily B ATP-binding cassette protein MsbA